MDVTLHERSAVDRELEIHVPFAELEPRLSAALKEQRKKTNLKGFRPGRAPMPLVRRMHGEQITFQIAEEFISEAWREHADDDLDVLGGPQLVELDTALDKDLRAVLRFGVRPTIEIKDDLSDETVRRITRPVTDDDLEAEIQRRLARDAKLEESDEPADETSVLIVDVQALDESGTPIIGQRDADREVDLSEDNLRPEMREALLGKKAGDEFRIDLDHQHEDDEGHDHDDHTDRLQVTVKTVRRRDVPALDEDFVSTITAGMQTSVEEYRETVRRELETAARRMGDDVLREDIIQAFLRSHDFDAPEALVDSVLDNFEQDLARRIGGELPEGFDTSGYRAAQRPQARQVARWSILHEQLLKDFEIELTEEDFEAEFERLAENGPASADMIKQFIQAQPGMLGNIRERLVSERLFGQLESRFTVRELTPEEYQAEQEAEAQAAIDAENASEADSAETPEAETPESEEAK